MAKTAAVDAVMHPRVQLLERLAAEATVQCSTQMLVGATYSCDTRRSVPWLTRWPVLLDRYHGTVECNWHVRSKRVVSARLAVVYANPPGQLCLWQDDVVTWRSDVAAVAEDDALMLVWLHEFGHVYSRWQIRQAADPISRYVDELDASRWALHQWRQAKLGPVSRAAVRMLWLASETYNRCNSEEDREVTWWERLRIRWARWRFLREVQLTRR